MIFKWLTIGRRDIARPLGKHSNAKECIVNLPCLLLTRERLYKWLVQLIFLWLMYFMVLLSFLHIALVYFMIKELILLLSLLYFRIHLFKLSITHCLFIKMSTFLRYRCLFVPLLIHSLRINFYVIIYLLLLMVMVNLALFKLLSMLLMLLINLV